MTFFITKGSHSWELQVGTLVVQLRRRKIDHGAVGFEYTPKLVNGFIDPFGSWRPRWLPRRECRCGDINCVRCERSGRINPYQEV